MKDSSCFCLEFLALLIKKPLIQIDTLYGTDLVLRFGKGMGGRIWVTFVDVLLYFCSLLSYLIKKQFLEL